MRVGGTEPDARDHVERGEDARLLERTPVALLRSYTARRLGMKPGLRFCVLGHWCCNPDPVVGGGGGRFCEVRKAEKDVKQHAGGAMQGPQRLFAAAGV